jgi:hypothetical protein
MTKTSFARMSSRRSSLSFLLVATGFAATLACGLTDDDDKGDQAQDGAEKTGTAALEPSPGGNAPNGLAFPMGVQDWGVIGASTRADQGEMHVVVGNAMAVQAARSGETNPWPDGSALAHLAFKAEQNPVDTATINAGAFSAVTLMMKDSAKYAADGGWAYGAWMGENLMPPAAADFDRACVNCHTSQVQDKDYVFTDPGQLPTQAQVDEAADAPNGVVFPDKILEWRVIGMARVSDTDPAKPGTLRVVVGNPTAVTAARSGNTDPWPDGSMISHYMWAAGSNPDIDKTLNVGDAITPAGFNAFTLMQRSSTQYADKGDWDYGLWTTSALTAQTDPAFSQGCVDCHTSMVADRDMVFTRLAEFPPMLMPAGASVTR